MRRVIVLILWYLSTCLLQAQTPIIPEKITIEDGLSQGFISAIHQDQEGFLWFGTIHGLNRYDGRQFEEFTHNPDNLYSISDDWIESITEKGDFLIIGTHSPYLNLFHKKTKKCYSIPLNVNGVEPFSLINSIVQVAEDQYWINTTNKAQIVSVVFPTQFWEQFPADKALLKKVKVEQVLRDFGFHTPTQDSSFLLINNGNTQKKLNISTLDTSSFHINTPNVQLDIFQPLTSTLSLAHSKFSPAEQFELYRLEEGSWREITSDFHFKPITYYDPSANLIWLQRYSNNTLLAYKPNAIVEAEQLTEQDATYMIKDIGTTILNFYKDRSGILWVGTAGLGLVKMSPRKLVIRNYWSGTSISHRIFPFDGGIFLGYTNMPITEKGKNSKTNRISNVLKQLSPLKTFWLIEGDQQWLAIVNEDKTGLMVELVLYHYREGNLIETITIPMPDAWIDGELSMIRGRDQKFYISFTDYFVQYDPIANTYQSFSLDLFKQNLPSFFYLAQTANETFWIGTSQGLIKVQAKGDSFDFQLIQEGLKNKICASFLVDPSDGNILWIGTKGGGLHRLDTRTMEFEYLNSQNGLPNDVIYGVLNDEEGNLWLSSNKGIINYNPETGNIRNFTSEDGMQSDEFNTSAFGKSSDGTLMFGGINGLNVFHPKDLKDNPYVPEVRITGLEINNEAINPLDSTSFLKTAIEFTDAITLDYAQNSIALSFAALEFTAPSKNMFSYYLEGAEVAWSHTTTDNRAAYLNLSPGKYTFKVKAANGDLVWSEKVTTLDIIILPPWYGTIWAYLFYALLIGLGLWWWNQFQRNRLQLRHQLELETQEAKRLKELDGFRSRFYTNLTHEFRTPLTLILGTIRQFQNERSKDHPDQKRFSRVYRNGNNLLQLVNDMLDLSKLEHNALKVHYEQGDLLRYLKYLLESFTSLANTKNVLLRLESNKSAVWMDYDEEKIRQIFSNLLSNAVKHTPSGGKVVVEANEQAAQFQLKVTDTGKGIASSDLPHIFDRFYQADNAVTQAGGTGVGLALTKELVQLLGGNISVESEVGLGSSFIITLPIHRDAPNRSTAYPINIPAAETPPLTTIRTEVFLSNTAPRLLVIEDNLDLVEYLNDCLKSKFRLDFAYNGAIGIEKALAEVPDIIISDVMMPEKTGFEVTQALKQDERTSHIPIILLTAKTDFESRIKGLKQGADVYLSKPFHQEELLINIDNLLLLRRNLQEKYKQILLGTDSLAPAELEDPEQLFLSKLNEYVKAELSNPELKAEDIAQKMGISRSGLYAKMAATTGMSFSQFVRTLRLNHAKSLIQNTHLQIAEIAFRVGFKEASYFTRQFKKQFGYTPTEIRG